MPPLLLAWKYGCDPFLSVEHALNLSGEVKLVKTRDEIFEQCDYITVHVPLLDDTKGMINSLTVEKMKDGVVILNFARDLLVNDDAILSGIASGKIARYDICDGRRDRNSASRRFHRGI